MKKMITVLMLIILFTVSCDKTISRTKTTEINEQEYDGDTSYSDEGTETGWDSSVIENLDDEPGTSNDSDNDRYTEEGQKLREKILNRYKNTDMDSNTDCEYITDMMGYMNDDSRLRRIVNNMYDYLIKLDIKDIEEDERFEDDTNILSWCLLDIEQDGIPELMISWKILNEETDNDIQATWIFGFDYDSGEYVALQDASTEDVYVIVANDLWYSPEYHSIVVKNETYDYYIRSDSNLALTRNTTEVDMDVYSLEHIDFIYAYTIG